MATEHGADPGEEVDAVVVGGGFFGAQVALALRERLPRVVVVEREEGLLRCASYANQARVHNGYHYPRSILTAFRSRVNFPRFCEDFESCVVSSFAKYYAVAQQQSKVTAAQFATFCQRIGAPLRPAPAEVRGWFDPAQIEEVWEVEEYAFDAERLAAIVGDALAQAGVAVAAGWTVRRVAHDAAGDFTVEAQQSAGEGTRRWRTRWLLNCTYAGINTVLEAAGRPAIPLKHELAEMALVRVPEPLRAVGVTVMCGPFFSIMPFPPRGLHSLSHVRYTPHCAWEERTGPRFRWGRPVGPSDLHKRSYYEHMIRDASRYMPILAGCEQVDSLWAIKTVLPQSEGDDSRPILFRRDPELPRLVSIMGGKIDNIYDLPSELEQLWGAT